MRRAFVALSVCALLALAWPALAEDVAKARKLFADGVHQYQVGDYEGALRLFREANAEHHAPAIVYNMGLAEERLGHRQAAVDAYESYVAEAGDKGEFTSAAVAAIAQIRATSTKLRIESKPAGAHVFLDGNALVDPAPVTVLVGAGHHVVIVQGDGWRAEKELEAKSGEPATLALEQPEAPAPPRPPVGEAPIRGPSQPPPEVPVATPPIAPSIAPPNPEAPVGPDGFVWGAHFAVAPGVMLGVDAYDDQKNFHENNKTIPTVLAGPLLEVGYAITDKIEFLARGLAGIGPDGKPSTMFMGGPGLSFKLGPIWAGATFIGGEIDSARHKVKYGTDLVFGVMSEISIAVIKKPYGEWLAGIGPSFLLTEMRNDNTTVFFPMTFGYRAY